MNRLLLSAVTWSLVYVVAFAAPAPLTKTSTKKTVSEVAGTWDFTFGGSTYVAVFTTDGEYRASGTGTNLTKWHGRWEMKDRNLLVREREVSYARQDEDFVWEFPLTADEGHGGYSGKVTINGGRNGIGYGPAVTLYNRR